MLIHQGNAQIAWITTTSKIIDAIQFQSSAPPMIVEMDCVLPAFLDTSPNMDSVSCLPFMIRIANTMRALTVLGADKDFISVTICVILLIATVRSSIIDTVFVSTVRTG